MKRLGNVVNIKVNLDPEGQDEDPTTRPQDPVISNLISFGSDNILNLYAEHAKEKND